MAAGMESLERTDLERVLGPQLTVEQAAEIFEQGREAVIFALMAQAKLLAERAAAAAHQDPSCPSGQTPPYAKPNRSGRQKVRGGRPGHPAHRRARPTPTHFVEHHLPDCPKCHGPVSRTRATRQRIIEDIPEDITPVVTEHTIPRYWCAQCQTHVEPPVADALPGAQIGLRVMVLSAWLHYLLGTTLAQIIDVFNFHLHFPLTAGGLVQAWHRLRELLLAWYDEIHEQALSGAVLHGDETGWRVNGQTHWLWCFSNAELTYYLIDRCRGSPALKKFFKSEYDGVLVTDFWGAYNAVVCADKQKCLPHLLRDLKRTTHYHRPGDDWPVFAKTLKRLIRDSLRLQKQRGQLSNKKFVRLRGRLHNRLATLLDQPWQQKQARRLVKRLRRHRNELFTFLNHTDVPADNNHAEREIRPAVIARKNSYGNGSDDGALTQAVLMSVFRTLKQRGHHPVAAVVTALRIFLQSGQLPSLPNKTSALG